MRVPVWRSIRFTILLAVAASPVHAEMSVEVDTDRPGNDLRVMEVPDVARCRKACEDEPLCRAYTFVRAGLLSGPGARCFLKSPIPAPVAQKSGLTSGVRMTTEWGIERSSDVWIPGSVRRVPLRPGQDHTTCAAACAPDPGCRAYTYRSPASPGDAPTCELMSQAVWPFACEACVSGQKPDHVGPREYIGQPTGGLSVPPAARTVSEGIGQLSESLTAVKSTIWTTRQIPVCWEEFEPRFADHRGWVRDQIAKTWERFSTLQFTGWGRCARDARGIRIHVEDAKNRTLGLGTNLDGKTNGMNLNFEYKKFGSLVSPPPGMTPLEFTLRAAATHEFGHALGFAHEQYRADAPLWCQDTVQREPNRGHDGDIYMTPYDNSSIMNYCSPLWSNGGALSPYDIAGLQFWYGPDPSSKIPWRPDCRSSILLFEDSRLGGRCLQVTGTLETISVESFNDKASSLCVPAGFRVIVYEDAQFRGRSRQFDGPSIVDYVGDDWNDRITAIQVVDLRIGSVVYDVPKQCRAWPMLYDDTFFRGKALDLTRSIGAMSGEDFNDKASAACVPVGERVVLFNDSNMQGQRLVIEGPAFIQRLSGLDWNDRASSAQCTPRCDSCGKPLGACNACPPVPARCQGKCGVDECGNACTGSCPATNQQCVNGACCVPDCKDVICGLSKNDCGACRSRCPAGQTCRAGQCRDIGSCVPPERLCVCGEEAQCATAALCKKLCRQ